MYANLKQFVNVMGKTIYFFVKTSKLFFISEYTTVNIPICQTSNICSPCICKNECFKYGIPGLCDLH